VARRFLDPGEVVLDQGPHEVLFPPKMVKQSPLGNAGFPGYRVQRKMTGAAFGRDFHRRCQDAFPRVCLGRRCLEGAIGRNAPAGADL
jgi:hypothetical protein